MTDDEDPIARVILLGGAMVILPALVPAVRAAVRSWLLEHQVLVGRDLSLVPVPFMEAGLDLRRVVVLLVVLLAGAWVMHARSQKKESRHG